MVCGLDLIGLMLRWCAATRRRFSVRQVKALTSQRTSMEHFAVSYPGFLGMSLRKLGFLPAVNRQPLELTGETTPESAGLTEKFQQRPL